MPNSANNFVARATSGALRLGMLALAAAVIAGLAPVSLQAQDKPDPNAVVATLNGEPITEADLRIAREDFGAALDRYPEERHREILLDLVVNLRLMARAGDEAGLDDTEEFKRRMDFARGRLLRDMYFDKNVEQAITEDDLRKTYESAIGETEDEVHARHILVKTEEEAKAVIKELEGGKDFEELAKEKSTGPSGEKGGDLGYFAKEEMVAPFAEAAFALEKGKISAPVETQFGWHVIRVEDRRKRQPPSFEEVKDQVRQIVLRDRFAQLLEGLKKDAKLDIVEPPQKAE